MYTYIHSHIHTYRCDVIAMGVINAAKNIGMKKPIIVRLKGTNVEEAKKLIEVRVYVWHVYACMCQV